LFVIQLHKSPFGMAGVFISTFRPIFHWCGF
jgi:hypothetical protein